MAAEEDLEQLAVLRWESREEGGEQPVADKVEFVENCVRFFREGLEDGKDVHWLAVEGDEIIAELLVQQIPMVPRPCKLQDQFGYIADSYTKPEWRDRGIGSELLRRAVDWARREDLELLLVWPSARAVPFYERLGFTCENDVMQLTLREYRASYSVLSDRHPRIQRKQDVEIDMD